MLILTHTYMIDVDSVDYYTTDKWIDIV